MLKKNLHSKPFEQWEYDEVEQAFGLQMFETLPIMHSWVTATPQLDDINEQIQQLCWRLNKEVDNWNEEELKVKFIVPLLDLLIVDKPPLYKSFLDRNVGIEIGDIKLSGRIDWLLATGKKRPDTPFFMLHEYKPKRGAKNDPVGQLLVEMVAAQAINAQDKLEIPIHGALVDGNAWQFYVLQNKQYTRTREYDATIIEQLYQIVAMLQWIKQYVDNFHQ